MDCSSHQKKSHWYSSTNQVSSCPDRKFSRKSQKYIWMDILERACRGANMEQTIGPSRSGLSTLTATSSTGYQAKVVSSTCHKKIWLSAPLPLSCFLASSREGTPVSVLCWGCRFTGAWGLWSLSRPTDRQIEKSSDPTSYFRLNLKHAWGRHFEQRHVG